MEKEVEVEVKEAPEAAVISHAEYADSLTGSPAVEAVKPVKAKAKLTQGEESEESPETKVNREKALETIREKALSAHAANVAEVRAQAQEIAAAAADNTASIVRLGNRIMRDSGHYWDSVIGFGAASSPLPVTKNAKGEAKEPSARAKIRAYIETCLCSIDSQAGVSFYQAAVDTAKRLTVLYQDFPDQAAPVKRVGTTAGLKALLSLAGSRGKVWGDSDGIRASISPILARADQVPGKVLRSMLADAGAFRPSTPAKSLDDRILAMERPDLVAVIAKRSDIASVIAHLPGEFLLEVLVSNPALLASAQGVVAKRKASASA